MFTLFLTIIVESTLYMLECFSFACRGGFFSHLCKEFVTTDVHVSIYTHVLKTYNVLSTSVEMT